MNIDSAKYTVVEFINAFGTKAYALRSPSGVDIDTDYANEQKLQRRADDLNKEIEVASANLRMRNMELEAEITKMKEAIEGVLYLTNQDVEDGFRIDIPKLVAYRLRLKEALKAEQSPAPQGRIIEINGIENYAMEEDDESEVTLSDAEIANIDDSEAE